MTDQMRLIFVDEMPLHRERDRPKEVRPSDWSAFVDQICVRGGVRFTHESLIRDLHRCCPQWRMIRDIAEIGIVQMMHWQHWWDVHRSDTIAAKVQGD